MRTWRVGILVFLSCVVAPVDARANERPNVLFIAVDDLNDWIGPLKGYHGVQTPNIDRIATSSTVFTRAYCAAPACNPSRTALMTGLLPSTTGVYLNGQPWRPVLPDAVTIGQYFRANGYRVEGGGKIFHSGSLRSIYNDRDTWDNYFDKRDDPQPENRPVNGIANAAHFDWGPLSNGDEEMGDYHTATWATQFLQAKHDKPFFLAVGFYKPHLPWYVPQSYFDKYPLGQIKLPVVPDDDLDDIPDAGLQMAKPQGDHRKVLETDNWHRAIQGYLASITFADAQIGRVLDALENSSYRDNTIVVLWSDHGWHLGEKQHWRKFALWEEACRVVLMIRPTGSKKSKVECGQPVNLVDIYPTLIELCGLPPRELDGTSLVPLLQDPTRRWERPSLSTHGRNNHALRSERFRYIRYADGSEELYDHETDPMEWKNLAKQPEYADVIASMRKWLPQTNVKDAPREAEDGNKKTKKKKAKARGK